MREFGYYSPTRIVFGEGKLKEVANFLPPNCERIFIVTGKHSSKANGSLDLLKASLKVGTRHGVSLQVFDEVEENPGTQTVNKAASIVRKEKVDLVIGLGGGSPMDAAKWIALLATNKGLMEDYVVGPRHGVSPPLPVIAIPTTAGTGSEVNQHAVIVVDGRKKGYSNHGFFPKVAILDPLLTLSMPYEITVNTGVDALTHAIEGYLSLRSTPISDSLALEAINIIKEWLPISAANGKDIEARSRMLYASMLGGLVISQSGTIILHALSYSLTTFYGVPHGRATGALLPWALEFLSDFEHMGSPLQEKISQIIQIFGGNVNNFIANLDISTRIRDYGITETDIPRFVQDAWGRRNLPHTPKEVSPKGIENIYKQAI